MSAQEDYAAAVAANEDAYRRQRKAKSIAEYQQACADIRTTEIRILDAIDAGAEVN